MDWIPAFAHPTQSPLFPAISPKFVGYMGLGCSRRKIVRLGGEPWSHTAETERREKKKGKKKTGFEEGVEKTGRKTRG